MSDLRLDAVLIPLRTTDALLLPNLAVLDVLGNTELAAAASSVPGWLAGHCDWQGQRVPVIRFEQFVPTPLPVDADIPPRRERIVILQGLSLPLAEDTEEGAPVTGRLFGVISVGHPHMVTVNRMAIAAAPAQPGDATARVLSRVRLANRAAVIPDLAGIDAQLAVLP
ncbi:MAG: hypothetical protein KF823_10280 [Xanthomonadales bacterium]|nr:hypothetical protein [Xanthomonadales bacterium]HJO35513.1 hypothetical protein [Gammaproteobacteria bacterium]